MRKNDLQSQNSNIDELLIHVCGLAWEHGALPREKDLEGFSALGEAVGDGFLVIKDERFEIPDAELYVEYLFEIALDELDAAWDSTSKFLDSFRDIQRRLNTLGIQKEKANELLILLAQVKKRNLLERLKIYAIESFGSKENPRPLFWMFCRPLCSVLKDLPDIKAEEIVDCLEHIVPAAGSDMAFGMITKSIEDLCDSSPGVAEEMRTLLIDRDEHPVQYLLEQVLVGTSHSNFGESYNHIIDGIDSENETIRRAMIAAVGRLDYSAEDTKDALKQTIDKLESLYRDGDEALIDVITWSFGNLIEFDENVGLHINEISSASHVKSRFALANVLMKLASDFGNEDWYNEVLFNLVHMTYDEMGSIQQLDACLSELLNINADVVVEFLLKYVEKNGVPPVTGRSSLAEVFSITLTQLNEQYIDHFLTLFIQSLLSNSPDLHLALIDTVSYFTMLNSEDAAKFTTFKPALLTSCNNDQVVYICDRFLGYSSDGNLQARLLISLLSRQSNSKEVEEHIFDALEHIVLYNYPESGTRYLEEVLDEDHLSDEHNNRIREALDHSEKYYTDLGSVPRLAEFDTSTVHNVMFSLAKQKHREDIDSAAKEQSVMMQLMKNIPIKQGKSFFTKSGGTFTEPVGMKPISTSIEIPRSILIDPVGYTMHKNHLRGVGLTKDGKSGDN